MKKLIPKIIDVICFVGGSALTLIFMIIGINEKFQKFTFIWISSGGKQYPERVLRLDYSVIIPIVIGVCLIIWGILIRLWRKEKINSN